MSLLLTITVLVFIILIVKFVLPFLRRYSQLKKDYQNISLLPISSIPFIGNLLQYDKDPHLLLQLILRQTKECQDQNIGAFFLDCILANGCLMFSEYTRSGQTIRKSAMVDIFIYGIHHDANVYPNPEKFDPERFASSTLTSNERSPFAYIPFSAGSRNCIGQRFAGLEERVVLSTLFRHFSFRSTQSIDELHLAPDIILRAQVPIQIVIQHQ